MAENEPTTPTPLPVSPRPLVIPYVLTPEELAGLLRVGDALAGISERLAAVMGRPGGPLAGELQALVEEVLVTLDRLDGDPDLEPDADGESTATERSGAGFIAAGGAPDDAEDDDPIEDDGDLEPSLGWTIGGNTASGNGHRDLDAEQDLSDEEPSLGALNFETRMTVAERHPSGSAKRLEYREGDQTAWGSSGTSDLERDISDDERSRQPVRLDVALVGKEAAHV